MLRIPIIVLCLFTLVSCGNSKETNEGKKNAPKGKELFTLISPKNGSTFKTGDVLSLNVKTDNSDKIDSCILNIDNKFFKTFNSFPYNVPVTSIKMGIRRMTLDIYTGNNVSNLSFALKIVPASAPQQYNYKVVKEYPHDTKAYTQGLFYSDGYLYEGTGQEGQSSLRKVELETGIVLQKHSLDNKYFGEGVCLHNGKIYQLTWKNREGFIYNYSDFSQVGKFNYNSEGWGLTSDGKNLWMSDGTAMLYRLNPDNMNIIDKIEVYTNKGPERDLNELEYINGEIWANVYTKDYIVIINPETGEITGKINLDNILRKDLRKPDTDVLNGIAYDKDKNRIFVTGKNWARLFQIEIYK